MKTVAVLGSGSVGVTLAKGFDGLGYKVILGNRSGVLSSQSQSDWGGQVAKYADAAIKADLVVLAVKGSAAEDVISGLKDAISGKTIIDTTNPISDEAPDQGVLKYFTSLEESLMERLQAIAPEANFVKAFNSVGNAYMVNPNFKDGVPSMFICGNNAAAKIEVTEVLQKFGWQTEDFGSVKSARAIEPLCMLWCIPGILNGEWAHAFKLLRD